MHKSSWRLRDLWFKHSRPLGGLRMMNFIDFTEAMQDFIRSLGEEPDETPAERDARKAAEE